ncbi:Ig-like domain repeat protein [Alloacidobacterium dinghuense]|uniref:Ig-like domain repeat protein n=1 Tax=Alloacidobacterium dinghuense TaxID=2763107 RepID=A0A7G8BFA4_9BACT|nr:Ig-like domain-containing protein [Alloacidobacterium dinghuense]QNI31224.1 Ig-like domain repeat protein [Alloacidobacterium dinghuense]
MSLQSSSNIWKSNNTATIRRGSHWAAFLALFLLVAQSHGQTIGTRTALSVATEAAKTTLSVTVKDPTGAAVSDGTVSFVSNGQSLGSAIVQDNGTAMLTLDKIPAFARQITAVYSGSGHYAASTSASANLQANNTSAPPDFSVTANPTSLNLNPGDFGTVIITVTPENGFTQSVTLALSGLPTTTTSSRFTPSIVTPTSTAAVTSTLQIQTTASSSSSRNEGLPGSGGGFHLTYAMLFPGVLALVGIGALRKRGGNGLRLMGVAVLLLASASGLTACSQRYSYLHHPPTPNTGTPPGTYNVTLTAYSNNGGEVTTHSLALTVTVK